MLFFALPNCHNIIGSVPCTSLSWYLQIQALNGYQRRIRLPIRDAQLTAEIIDTPGKCDAPRAVGYPQVNIGVRWYFSTPVNVDSEPGTRKMNEINFN